MFAKLQKVTISCVMSVYPSVHVEHFSLHGMDFHEICYLSIFFQKPLRKLKFHWNQTRIMVLYMKTDIHFWSYLAQFFLEWEMLQIQVVQKIKTHILCSVTFFLIMLFIS